MATELKSSVELPSALIEEAYRYAAQEGRPLQALIEEAMRLYMETGPAENAFFRSNREKAKALGLSLDEYATKLVKEARAEKRLERRAS